MYRDSPYRSLITTIERLEMVANVSDLARTADRSGLVKTRIALIDALGDDAN